MSRIVKVENLKKDYLIKQKSAGFWNGIKAFFKAEYKLINAVNDISFEVNEGEAVALIGPNGAGKSTTIKMLCGILFPSSGSIDILGFNPAKDRTALAFKIGSVFGQKSQLWFHLPPIDSFYVLSKIYELKESVFKEQLQFLTKTFEIENILTIPVRKLSLGQRMKCEIVASLIHKPQIIFLDEPTIGLDVVAKQQVRDVLKYLNEKEGVTIFLTSHDAGDIEAITKRTIIINHGKIVFDDTTENLKRNYIRSKVIDLVMEDTTQNFNYDAGKILEQTNHSIQIQIDNSIKSIENLLDYALKNFKILDINIHSIPLEEIISNIYTRAHDDQSL